MANESDSEPAPSKVSGAIAYGYPFHPPGKPDKLRVDHLSRMTVPLCVLQGERDTFGKREEVDTYPLNDNVSVFYLDDGDHSFKPRKTSGMTQDNNIEKAAEHTQDFIKRVISGNAV
jgi:predicted alpha/beta-hydrolase family hydrolase